MRDAHTTRTIARSLVVAGWLLALAIAGEPAGLAVSLAAALALVWACPYLLVTTRRREARRAGGLRHGVLPADDR
jgi:Zn-dependent protease with chaperone function